MNFLSDKANNLTPYVPGEQPKEGGYTKLNTNENPYPPSSRAINKIKDMNLENLRLYPDSESNLLREVYAKSLGLDKDNIFVGNGSDEVLAIAFQTFFMKKNNVLMPDISYSFYPVYCRLYDITSKLIPLREDYSIDTQDYMIENNGIVIANPNAPTSLLLSKDKIENIVKNNKNSIVLIDEAYVDFGGESVVSLINKYNNLLVVKTLSKSYSLAGMRVGFAIGNKALISGMNRVKDSFNSYPIDTIAQQLAYEAILDVKYFEKTRKMIIDTRERVSKELIKLEFNVLDSKTNFLFIQHKEKYAEEIFDYLKENKILVRYFKKPRLDNWLRVTIGNDEQMEYFIKYIIKLLQEK